MSSHSEPGQSCVTQALASTLSSWYHQAATSFSHLVRPPSCTARNGKPSGRLSHRSCGARSAWIRPSAAMSSARCLTQANLCLDGKRPDLKRLRCRATEADRLRPTDVDDGARCHAELVGGGSDTAACSHALPNAIPDDSRHFRAADCFASDHCLGLACTVSS